MGSYQMMGELQVPEFSAIAMKIKELWNLEVTKLGIADVEEELQLMCTF